MKAKLPSTEEWKWLKMISMEIGLIVSSGKSTKLVFNDLDLMTLLEIVSEQFICNGGHPTTLEKILAVCDDESANTLKDTKRKYIYELLEKLIYFGFVKYIKVKEYNSVYEEKVKHHGSANLYYVSGKGFLAQQLLFLYPHITNKHFNFLKSGKPELFHGRQSFLNLFVIFEKQWEFDNHLLSFVLRKQDSEMDSNKKDKNPLFSVLNEASKLLDGNYKEFKELVCPATYYLCEYSNLYLQRHDFNISRKSMESSSIGFSIKYISFLINFFESELRMLGFKNPKNNLGFLF